jgi:hypothetical protein
MRVKYKHLLDKQKRSTMLSRYKLSLKSPTLKPSAYINYIEIDENIKAVSYLFLIEDTLESRQKYKVINDINHYIIISEVSSLFLKILLLRTTAMMRV